MSTPEGLVLKSIMEHLAARRIFAVRMNSGTQIGSYKGKKWAIHMNAPGTADILAFKHLRSHGVDDFPAIIPFWIEVKAAKGKQSESQKAFQAMVEAKGHRYILARSIDDVEGAL